MRKQLIRLDSLQQVRAAKLRTLSAAAGPHDHDDFPSANREVHAFQYGAISM
jgi:hypothetical protein